jgi:O-antigen ligase
MSKISRVKKSSGESQDIAPLLERILKIGILVVVCAIPLLYFPERVFPFVTSKVYFFQGAIDVLLIAYVWLAALSPSYRPHKKQLLFFVPLVLLLISLTISAIVGVDVLASFFGTIERGTGLVFLYHAAAFAFMVSSLVRVRGRQFLKAFLQVNFAAAALVALTTFFTPMGLGAVSKILESTHGGGMIGNSSFAGAYFLFALFGTGILFAMEAKRYQKIIYSLGILLILFSPVFFNIQIWKGGVSLSSLLHSPLLLLGEARMAAISIPVGLLVVLFAWLLVQRRKIGKVAGGILMSVLVAGLITIAGMTLLPSTKLHKSFISGANDSRFIFWDIAEQGIKECPFFGYGPENYRFVYQTHFNPSILNDESTGEVSIDRPHNSVLEMTVNGGFVGGILYVLLLGFLFVLVIISYKKGQLSRHEAAIFTGLFAAYILQNLLVFDSVATYMMLFGIMGILVGLQEKDMGVVMETRISKDSLVGATLGAIVLVIAWAVFAIFPAMKIGVLTQILYKNGKPSEETFLSLASAPGGAMIQTDFGYLAGVLIEQYQQKLAATQEKTAVSGVLSDMNILSEALNTLSAKRPKDFALQFSGIGLTNLQMLATQTALPSNVQRAILYGEKAIALSPENPRAYLALSETYVYSGNIPKAREFVDKALAINPRVRATQLYKIQFETFFGTPASVSAAKGEAHKHFPDIGQ